MGKRTVAIIGAGISGLTAAQELLVAGHEVHLFEARLRTGGRLQTLREPLLPPIELGAEFIHGAENETWDMFDKLPAFQTTAFPDRHWQFKDGKLIENKHFWEDLSQVLEKIDSQRKDKSFSSFLRRISGVSHESKSLANDYVEGFQAAKPSKIGVKAIEAAEKSTEETKGQKSFHLKQGYSALIDSLEAQLTRDGAQFHFDSIVRQIIWKRGTAKLLMIDNARSSRKARFFQADAVLITIPAGVWRTGVKQLGAISFKPVLKARQKLFQKLQMGNVVKLILAFDKKLWPKEVSGFIHAHGQPFPTLWVRPKDAVLTAWAGGPRADALAGLTKNALAKQAIKELALVFDLPQRLVRQSIKKTFWHDWGHDPFSRGAYSYIPVGMAATIKRLAEPVQGTLFFAGEMFAPPGEEGTVHGAIASGKAATKEMLHYFRRRLNTGARTSSSAAAKHRREHRFSKRAVRTAH